MKAAVVYKYGDPIDVVETSLGDVGPNDIRVQIKASGLCHSDVATQTGDLPFPLPIILGHEGAGLVTEVGGDVTQTKAGDHVVLSALIHCGQCEQCAKGNHNICSWGLGALGACANPDGTLRASDANGQELFQFAQVGTLAEELICNEKHAVPIPDDVPFEVACLAGCGVLTGMGAVVNRAKVQQGESVVVIGCGGVGLNVIQSAAMVGASPIIAVDIHQDKLDMAENFGATHSVLSGPGVDVPTAVMELTGGLGADYAFEVVGVPELVRQAWDCLAMDGTAIGVGVSPAESEFLIPADAMAQSEKTLMASMYGSSRPTEDIPKAIEYYREGKLKFDELITHHFELEDINAAVDKMHAGHDARGIVVF
ncbi:MAG: zinc-binding dehydrogenase [Acidimicrobiales bacterium]